MASRWLSTFAQWSFPPSAATRPMAVIPWLTAKMSPVLPVRNSRWARTEPQPSAATSRFPRFITPGISATPPRLPIVKRKAPPPKLRWRLPAMPSRLSCQCVPVTASRSWQPKEPTNNAAVKQLLPQIFWFLQPAFSLSYRLTSSFAPRTVRMSPFMMPMNAALPALTRPPTRSAVAPVNPDSGLKSSRTIKSAWKRSSTN